MTKFRTMMTCLVAAAFAATLIPDAVAQDAAVQDISEQDNAAELQPLLPKYEIDPDAYETDEEKEELEVAIAEANAHNASLTPQTGTIDLPRANVVMEMGDNHYFLNPADGKKVLVDLWENPPNPELLGMIFERGTDGYSNDYAVAVYYEASGYVSDEDASTIDYAELLKDMKTQTRQESNARVKQGYDAMELIGWGADPEYDAENHRVSWAKLLKFNEAEDNTLNYNLRFLGRKGVLEFKYVANEDALPSLQNAMPAMVKMAKFKPGSQYSDFNPATDKVASYGLAGLVAGGVVAKKLGLLGVLLVFLKKGWIVIFAALAFGRRFLSGLFGRKSDDADT